VLSRITESMAISTRADFLVAGYMNRGGRNDAGGLIELTEVIALAWARRVKGGRRGGGI